MDYISSFDFISENFDVAESTSDGFLTIHIPTRGTWMGRRRWRRDEENLNARLEEVVFIRSSSLKHSFRLTDHCSGFLILVATIKATLDILLWSTASFKEVSIHSDSRSAIIALGSPTVRLKLVKEYLSSISMASSYIITCIILIWVPGLCWITVNCKAMSSAIGHELGLCFPLAF